MNTRPGVACWLCRARFDEHCVDIRGELFGRRDNPHPKGPPLYGEHWIRRARRAMWQLRWRAKGIRNRLVGRFNGGA